MPVFMCCGLLAGPAFTQEKTLSLDEAIAVSLRSNPDVRRAAKDIEAARARTLQLGAPPNPDLFFSNEGLRLGPGAPERELSLGLRQQIEFPGKRGLRRAVGLKGEQVSEANLDGIWLRVVARVKRAYFQAAYSEMTIGHLQSVLDMLGEYQKLAAIRFKAGEVTSTDVLRGRLEEVRVRNELIEAKRRLQLDQAGLWLEMGAETPPAFPQLEPLSFTPFGKGLGDLKSAAGERPAIRALRRELDLRETSIRLARKDFYPDLRLGLFYPSLNTSGWGFELEVSIPLWRRSLKGGVQEAEALRDEGAIALDAALRRTMNRIESAYADVRASSDQLSLVESSLLKDAADLPSAGVTNYQYGRIGSLDLFDIYRMNKDSRLQYLRALPNYHLALVDLEAAGEDTGIGEP